MSDLVWFQCGCCRAYGPWHEDVYHVGDRLRWQLCWDGRVLAWTYFWDGRHELGGNIGDPAVRPLSVKGGPEFYWEGPGRRWQDICGCPVPGAAIEIKDGIIFTLAGRAGHGWRGCHCAAAGSRFSVLC